jgi:hypothetical protein
LAGNIILGEIVLVEDRGRGLRTNSYMLQSCTGENIKRKKVCGPGSSASTRIGRMDPQTVTGRRGM